MSKGTMLGIFIALLGIIAAFTIVHHHEDEDKERERARAIFQYQRNGVQVEVRPPSYTPQIDYYHPRICDSSTLLALHNRAHIGHAGFYLDRNLCVEARSHAELMARNNHQCEPDSNRYRVASTAVGPLSEIEVFGYWMARSSSRYHIVSGDRHKVGFGSAIGQDGRVYWCALYR